MNLVDLVEVSIVELNQAIGWKIKMISIVSPCLEKTIFIYSGQDFLSIRILSALKSISEADSLLGLKSFA